MHRERRGKRVCQHTRYASLLYAAEASAQHTPSVSSYPHRVRHLGFVPTEPEHETVTQLQRAVLLQVQGVHPCAVRRAQVYDVHLPRLVVHHRGVHSGHAAVGGRGKGQEKRRG